LICATDIYYQGLSEKKLMKHNEQARVAPLDLAFTYSLRAQKKTQRAHHAHALWLGVWFACSLWSAFSGIACSARLDPSACSLKAYGARLPTNSTFFISLVSRFWRPRENLLEPLLRLLLVSQQAQVVEFVGAAELVLRIAVTTLRRLLVPRERRLEVDSQGKLALVVGIGESGLRVVVATLRRLPASFSSIAWSNKPF
jgi:hypothetical protein